MTKTIEPTTMLGRVRTVFARRETKQADSLRELAALVLDGKAGNEEQIADRLASLPASATALAAEVDLVRQRRQWQQQVIDGKQAEAEFERLGVEIDSAHAAANRQWREAQARLDALRLARARHEPAMHKAGQAASKLLQTGSTPAIDAAQAEIDRQRMPLANKRNDAIATVAQARQAVQVARDELRRQESPTRGNSSKIPACKAALAEAEQRLAAAQQALSGVDKQLADLDAQAHRLDAERLK